LHLALRESDWLSYTGFQIFKKLAPGLRVDALRHIYLNQRQITDNPDKFPIEYRILQYIKDNGFNNMQALSSMIRINLEEHQRTTRHSSLTVYGEKILNHYYSPSIDYMKLCKQIEKFASAAEGSYPGAFSGAVAKQMEASGWSEKSTGSSYSDPETFLHSIQAIQRLIHTFL
jgi:hypothetical protein